MLERDSAALSRARAPRRAAARRPAPAGGRRPRCAAPVRASCTPTTSTRPSAGARWRRRARPARGSSCTCTTTGSSARSASASPAARTARAATVATRGPGVRAQLPRRLARRGGRLRRRRWRSWQRRLAALRRRTSSSRARSRSTACAALGAPLGDRAHGRPVASSATFAAALDARPPAASRWSPAGWPPEKGVADAIDGLPRGRACRSWSPATGRSGAAAGARRGVDVRFTGRLDAGGAGRAARAGRRWRSSRRRYAEILPLAALEAMAAGLPVVATRAGGLRRGRPAGRASYPPATSPPWPSAIGALWRRRRAGERALARARERTRPPRSSPRSCARSTTGLTPARAARPCRARAGG